MSGRFTISSILDSNEDNNRRSGQLQLHSSPVNEKPTQLATTTSTSAAHMVLSRSPSPEPLVSCPLGQHVSYAVPAVPASKAADVIVIEDDSAPGLGPPRRRGPKKKPTLTLTIKPMCLLGTPSIQPLLPVLVPKPNQPSSSPSPLFLARCATPCISEHIRQFQTSFKLLGSQPNKASINSIINIDVTPESTPAPEQTGACGASGACGVTSTASAGLGLLVPMLVPSFAQPGAAAGNRAISMSPAPSAGQTAAAAVAPPKKKRAPRRKKEDGPDPKKKKENTAVDDGDAQKKKINRKKKTPDPEADGAGDAAPGEGETASETTTASAGDKLAEKTETAPSAAPKAPVEPTITGERNPTLDQATAIPPAPTVIETEEPARPPIIALDIPLLDPNDPKPGQAQVVINVLKLTEEKYGWAVMHPDAKSVIDIMDDMVDDEEEVDEDDDAEGASASGTGTATATATGAAASNGQGAVAEKKEEELTEEQLVRKHEVKMNRKVGKYDYEDPFIDDEELQWEEEITSTKEGFFVYWGPLVDDRLTTKKASSKGKK